jgi:hypothetical protein
MSMKRRTLLQSIPALALLGNTASADSQEKKNGSAQTSTSVYELRVYHTYEGKLDDLLTRFREHTMRLLQGGHIDIQIKPVDRLELEGDVVLENLDYAVW